MKPITSLGSIASVLAFALTGTGTGTAAADAPAGPDAPAYDKLEVGGDFEVVTAGSLDATFGDQSDSASFGTTIGLGAHLDYRFHPNLSVGIAPRFIPGIQPEGIDESADELDLRVRLTGRTPMAPRVEGYGYLSAGYSTIQMPETSPVSNPSGVIFGAAAGVRYSLASSAFIGGEIGYQFGKQGLTMGGQDYELASQFLHIGVSAGIRR